MIKQVIFHEKSDSDYINYNKIWQDNLNRMVFLQDHLSMKCQINYLVLDMQNLDGNQKDILAIRFPSLKTLNRNKIYINILLGKGFEYEPNKYWHPNEIWIYSPFV